MFLKRARQKTDGRDQQFSITFRNDLFDFDLAVNLYVDGERIYHGYLRAGLVGQVLGVRKSANSVLPFKFQELELVGAFVSPKTFLGWHGCFDPHMLLKIRIWSMPLSCRTWGRLNFEPFAARPCAPYNTRVFQNMDCIKGVYQSAARRQGGITSGT